MKIIEESIPKSIQKDGHPAKRTFQAIRIEVNNEIKPLYYTVLNSIECLKENGRLCIITFHSLEDRAVKNAYIEAQGHCTCPKELPYCVCNYKSYVISAGNVPPNPSELLITPQMQRLLEKLSSQCDIVIVDAPPCELVTDAAILSRIVDSTVIVTAHKFTKKASLQKTIKSIKNVGGKIAGVVLNKVPIDAKKYEKSYYYGSQLTTTRGKREANYNTSSKDFFENESKNVNEDNIELENKHKKNDAENIAPNKTQEILRQVNEYLQQEKNNLNDTKRD